MATVLNVKVGDKVTFTSQSGESVETLDAKIVAFPKIIRVQTTDGRVMDITPEQVITEHPAKSSGGHFPARLNQSRL